MDGIYVVEDRDV